MGKIRNSSIINCLNTLSGKMLWLLFFTTVLAYSFSYAQAWAAEFTADLVRNRGDGVITGKIFLKGTNFRQEMVRAGQNQVMIYRKDKNLAWILMPDSRMYMEMPGLAQNKKIPQMDQKVIEDMADKKFLGQEKLNGYICDKYRYDYHNKSYGSMTQWYSIKLNIPIKTIVENPYGRFITEYKNIEETGIPNSLFEIPEGYQKMSMPEMMKGMGK